MRQEVNYDTRYGMRFGIFLICQFIWTIFPLTFQSPILGEIARDIVTNDVRKKVNLDKDLLAILCCPGNETGRGARRRCVDSKNEWRHRARSR